MLWNQSPNSEILREIASASTTGGFVSCRSLAMEKVVELLHGDREFPSVRGSSIKTRMPATEGYMRQSPLEKRTSPGLSLASRVGGQIVRRPVTRLMTATTSAITSNA